MQKDIMNSKRNGSGNQLKAALLERRLCVGTWIQVGHPAVAEILANVGFDWVAADCEHADIDVENFTNLARAMCGHNVAPMVRVRENDDLAIRQMLDAGAQGVIVPLVNTAEEARRAVAAAKYPPLGVRGFAFCRANNWGHDFASYAAQANEQVAVVVMIESKLAVDNIDEILDVDGVDGVFIGPYDMSGSYGVTGQTSHPLIQAACAEVVAACQRHKKSAGLHVVQPSEESINKACADGFTFIALGVDTVFIDQAARTALNCIQSAPSSRISHVVKLLDQAV